MPLITTRLLAQQMPDSSYNGYLFSVTRDIQVAKQVEDAFNALWGRGVLPGAPAVAAVSGATVKVPAGFALSADGVLYTVLADTNFTPAQPSATVWLWGRVNVTRPTVTPTTPNYATQDAYSLTLQETVGPTPLPPDGYTTVTTGAASATQLLGTTAGLLPGDTLYFATAGVSRIVQSVPDSTHVVLTASVTTVNGEAVMKVGAVLWQLLASWATDGSGNVTGAVDSSPAAGPAILSKWLHGPNQFGFRPLNLAGTGTYTLSPFEARDVCHRATGLLTGARTLVVPSDAGQLRIVDNATTGAFSLTVKVTGGTGVVVPQGSRWLLYVSNTDVVDLGPTAWGTDPYTQYLKADGTRPLSADWPVGSHKLTGLSDPTAAQDAATKAYVDAVATGLDVKASVRAATTANITLSGAQTIDGVSIIAGDRVLVKAQSTGSQNGLWLAAAGAWSRTTDADQNVEVTAGLFVFVEEGTANAGTGWVLTTANPITVGTTALTFTQFSGAGEITAGSGLTKSGNTLNAVANADGSIVANADDLQVGVLATDAQHGNRGGGALHANAVAAGAAGFLSGSDKSKLDGVATGAPALGLVIFGAQGALPSALTRYLAPGSGNVSINEIKIRLLVACVAQKLAVRVSAAPGTGVSDAYTIRKNGADTALTATVSDTNTEAEDTTHTVSFASGDDLSVKLASGLATASQDAIVSLLLA